MPRSDQKLYLPEESGLGACLDSCSLLTAWASSLTWHDQVPKVCIPPWPGCLQDKAEDAKPRAADRASDQLEHYRLRL